LSRYRTYGGNDDPIQEDLDAGFLGFNNYNRPDQLTQGMLASSLNGRLGRNGEWQVRPGIDLINAPFASGDAVLRLPTFSETQVDPTVVGLLPTTIRSAALASNVVSIVINDPAVEPGHVFVTGDEIYVENLVSTTTDPNGLHTITNVTDNGATITIEYALVGADETYGIALTLPFNLDDGGAEPLLTVLTESPVIGYNMILDQGSVAGVYASTAYSNPNDSGSQWILLASNISATAINLSNPTITYDLPYRNSETVPLNCDMLQAFNKVFLFRDGQTALEWDGSFNNVNLTDLNLDNTYLITDLGDTTQLQWNTIAGTTAVTYEVNDIITIDAIGTGTGTVRSGFSLVKSGVYTQPVQIDCFPGEFAIINSIASVSGSHDVKVGDDITVMSASVSGATGADSGLTIGQDYVVNKVFTLGEVFANITLAVNDGLEGPGDYEGLHKYTITTDVAHNLVSGEPIIMDQWEPNGVAFNGSFFAQGIPDSTNFIIYTDFNINPSPASYANARAGINAGFQFVLDSRTVTTHVNDGDSLFTDPIFTKRVSVGLGFTHMPAPPYATYHQRRLVMPFKYIANVDEGQYDYRGVLDEVIMSDILDSDTYDQIYNQYRFNAGTADFNVALHSFSDDQLLVFNRNSIHLVTGAGSSPVVQLITNEVGCVARKSIIQVGNNVLFLSDNGVYGANFQDLYNLRGNEVPLSSPIDPTIKRINKAVWDKSVGVYFDNKYYLAVPLDNSQVNNAILIFNFINKQWESIDTTADVDWNISNLIVGGKKADRAVYAVNSLGGLHRIDARLDAVDLLATGIPVEGEEMGVPYGIPASVTTRQYTFGSIDRKRWNNFELQVQSSVDSESNMRISAELENIDRIVELGTLSSLNSGENLARDEDISVRGRIGNGRAYGLQITLDEIVGRPRFRAIKVAGAEAFRSTNKAI
jgi:hypothetical protein